MKISEISKKGSKFIFELEDTTPAFANALRRTMANETPTMAMHKIEFNKNSSTLYDEMLAHRLGLIVLKTDLKSYNMPKKCTCDEQGCAKCQVKLTLDVKGPCTVYAKDIESQDPKIVPVYPNTIIVTLLKGQEIQFEATAKLGIGKDHAKWTPGLVYYRFFPTITVNNNSKKLEEFKDKYPQAIFDKSGKINKEKIIELDLTDACDGVCEDVLSVEYDNTRIIFYFEPWGQLDAKKTVQAACEVLSEKVEEFTLNLKAL